MKSVVVTGASGFIGGAVTTELLHSGYKVYGVGLGMENKQNLASNHLFVPIELPFEKYLNIGNFIAADEEMEAFFHFAWQGGFEKNALRDYSLQLYNAKYSCDAAVAANSVKAKKFIYAATINEIETQQFIRDFPQFQTRPTCVYASSKLNAELICRTIAQEKGMEYNAGIIPMLYGKGNKSKQLINTVISALIRGETPKLITGNNLYDVVSVNDIAKAFVSILERGKDGERYYIGHRQLKTFREWMEEIGSIVNPAVQLRFGEYQDPLNLDYSLLDMDALFRDTGFVCQEDFRSGILEHKKWLEDAITRGEFS